MVVEGKDYFEEINLISSKDMQPHTVKVFPMNHRQFNQVLSKSGMTLERLDEIGVEISKLQEEIAAEVKEGKPERKIRLEKFTGLKPFLVEMAEATTTDPPGIINHLLPGQEIDLGFFALMVTRRPNLSTTSSAPPPANEAGTRE